MSESRKGNTIEPDRHLQDVIVFMQSNVPAEKLVQTAEHIKNIAPLLWGHYARAAEVQALQVGPEPISAELRTQSAASEWSPCSRSCCLWFCGGSGLGALDATSSPQFSQR